MRSGEEIAQVFKIARENGSSKIELDGVTYFLSPEVKSPAENPTEIQMQDVFGVNDMSEEEILFYATDYYQELQLKKKQKEEALNGKE